MKKLVLTLVAAAGLFVVSCSSSPAEKATAIYKEATAAVKDAKTQEEAMAAAGKALQDLAALKLTPEEMKQVEEDADFKAASEEFVKVCEEKAKDF